MPDKHKKLPYRRCAGIMLINPDGLIFTGKRKDSDVMAWQMPQGGIDEGEKPRRAALRELQEETGITADMVAFLDKSPGWLTYDLPPDMIGNIWGGKYRGQRQKWFVFRFIGHDDRINIETDHPEFDRWQWMKGDDMVASIVPFKRDVYAKLVDEFRDYLA